MGNVGVALIILGVLALLAGAVGGLVWLHSTAAVCGIRLSHNGNPLDNLEVRMYDTGYIANSQLDGTFTTDGTGTVTYAVSHDEMGASGLMLYDFTYNGTTYSFSGPKDQIIVESV